MSSLARAIISGPPSQADAVNLAAIRVRINHAPGDMSRRAYREVLEDALRLNNAACVIDALETLARHLIEERP